MRILICSTYASVVGGVETYLRDLFPAFQKAGHTVGLLTSVPPDPRGVPIAPAGVPVWSFDGADPHTVLREVGEWRPDVAFAHGMASPEHEGEVLNRWPVVLFAHGHNATCVSGSRTHMFPAPVPCDKPFGVGCLAHYLPRRCGGLNPITALRLYTHARRRNADLARYAAVLVASRYMMAEYRQHGVPEGKLHLAPLFPTGHSPDTALADRGRTDRVLYVGRLYPEKGVRLLVDAVAMANRRLPRPLTLDIAGEGPEAGEMGTLADKFRVRVVFHGWVSPVQRVELMRSADVLAVPSICPETFGLVGVEAGCVGLPAVGFANGGIPDWLVPGVSGELAPGERPRADHLADAIVRALADHEHHHRLRVGAWETARRHTLTAHLDCLLPILRANSP